MSVFSNKRRVWAGLAGVLVLAVLGTIIVASILPNDENHLLIAQTADPAAAELGLWVAKEKGFFEDYGLTVDLTRIEGGTQAQVALSGAADIVFGGAAPFLCAASSECLDIAGLGPTLPYLLVTRPGIKTPADLRGATLGVSSGGLSTSRAALAVALQALGLDPKRDNLTILPAGGSGERLAGLAAGSLDGTVVLLESRPRIDALVAEGTVRILADLSTLALPWANEDVIVTRAFAAQNPEAIESFMKALIRAHAWIRQPANRDEALGIIVKHATLDSLEEAAPVYDMALTDLSLRPYPSREAMQTLVDVLGYDFPELAGADLEGFIDESWIQKLDAEGFIDSVSGGN